jgi:hypothetical protein
MPSGFLMRPLLNGGTFGGRRKPGNPMGLFTGGEVWTGGFYELALEYERGVTGGLVNGLHELWHLQDLEGCYLDSEREPTDQPRREFEASLLAIGHLYGVAALPGGVRVACGSCTVHETDGSDWLVFYFPMSALGHVYPVGGFPFDSTNHESWRTPLDNWLVDVGRRIFPRAPFTLGLVGFETSGNIYAADLVASGLPTKRHEGLLVPDGARLVWHPRTEVDG